MEPFFSSCRHRVDNAAKACPYCNGSPVKNGMNRAGKQRYLCKRCRKSFIVVYDSCAFHYSTEASIVHLLKEGSGIRSIARLLHLCPKTVIRRILKVAKAVKKPAISLHKTYEMDELRAYIRRKDKLLWVAYALRKDTRQVIDFKVGSRTNKTLNGVISTLLLSEPTSIYTDKLVNYSRLIPKPLHKTTFRGTNYIERCNLTLRTHLRRLSRRTICFTKSTPMLEACLKIYFWYAA